MSIITTTQLSSLQFGNRFDSELYNPRLLVSFNELQKTNVELVPISSTCIIRSGTTPPDRDDSLKSGAILFKTTDIRNNVLSPQGDYYHISYAIHNRMSKTRIKSNDVLLNIVGATLDVIGRSAIVFEGMPDSNITQAMVLLRIKKELRPGFLFAFLNTKYAQDQIKRYARPTGQFNLNLMEVGKILVPNYNDDIQKEVHEIVIKGGEYQEKSKSLYSRAEKLLNEELQLDQLHLSHKNWFVANYRDVFDSRRLDSNHFREEYSVLFDFFCERFTCKQLGQIVSLNRRGLQPVYVENGSVMVVNSKHLSDTHIKYDQTEKTSQKEYQKKLVARLMYGDVLIYTTGAYVGLTNCFNSNEQALASNHVNILRLSDKSIDPNYLALVLNSIIGKLQTQKHSRGSAQLELYPSDIAHFLVPIISEDKMKKIGGLVRDSLASLYESKRLLSEAIKYVEEKIEYDAIHTSCT